MKKKMIFSLFFLLLAKMAICQETSYRFTDEILNEVEQKKKNWQLKLWQLSFIGEYKKMLSEWDRHSDEIKISKFSNNFYQDFSPVDAKEAIINISNDEKIIIINEAHHQPIHRVFTASLLKGLFDNGFRYIGLEGIVPSTNGDSLLNTRKYPILLTGYAVQEPQYGNLIREAFEIGYKVFCYESFNSLDRDYQQAVNITNILKDDSNAKILIHCGYNHLSENLGDIGIKMMAEHLRNLTKINPFTINQVMLTEHSSPKYEHGSYPDIISKTSSVFVNKNKKYFDGNDTNDYHLQDLIVYHPPSTFINKRPIWLSRNGKWDFVKFPHKKVKLSYPIIAFIFNNSESEEEAVPIDVIEVENKIDDIQFVLPKGKYKLLLRNKYGSFQKLKIKNE